MLHLECVGFDLEYVPDYYASIYRQRGDRTRPAVVQIASVDTCIIYLVYKIGYLPECVSTLLTSDSILKVAMMILLLQFLSGVSWRSFRYATTSSPFWREVA